MLFASFSVVSLEGRCDKRPGEKKHKDPVFFFPVIHYIILGFGTAQNSQFMISPADFESNTSRLTDFIRRSIESFQFGAASQEICRNLLHVVLAHIQQLDLRKAQRNAKFPYTITEKTNTELLSLS